MNKIKGMNISNLKRFSKTLAYLPHRYSDIDPPECDKNCHAGLISYVANHDLPPFTVKKQLKQIYNWTGYDSMKWADALAQYLLGDDDNNKNRYHLQHWANMNPELWGNQYGHCMFSSEIAFDARYNTLTYDIIINHWRGVCERCELVNSYLF